MRSAKRLRGSKAATRHWVARAIGALGAVAGLGLFAAAPAFATTGTITVNVYSDTKPIDHVEGVPYDGTNGHLAFPIATFTDSDACPTPLTCQPNTDFTAVVRWGDFSTNTACPAADCSIALQNSATGTYQITASHTYKDEFNCQPAPCLNYPVHVTVTDTVDTVTGAGNNIAANGIAVKDQALTGTPATFTATSGVAFSGQIGSFQDANPLAALLDQGGSNPEYSLSIDWGDGTVVDATGTLTLGACAPGGCQVNVNGMHTYVNSNSYPVLITVQDGLDRQFKIQFTSTASVANDGGTRCSSANLLPSNTNAIAGSTVVLTAGAGGCSAPSFEFWAQYPGGVWHMIQAWGASTLSWNTTGLAVGHYKVHAWANQVRSSTWEAFAEATVNLTACASATLSPASSDQVAGTTVHFMASASGCGNPHFEYWIGYSNGTWQVLRTWGAANFDWVTNPQAAGHYTIHVWANNIGDSTATWEAFASSTINLTVCSSATLTPNPVNQTAGSTVSFMATSTGCLAPQYKYWIGYSNGTWQVLRDWGPANFDWVTSASAKGTYTVHVWANNIGDSTATWEAYASSTVTLT